MDKSINEAQKEIGAAYDAVSAIPVAGDPVELMAAAREHLRRAYRLAAPEAEEGGSDG